MTSLRIFGLALGIACGIPAWAAETGTKFEVADVRISPHSVNPDAYDMSGGLLRGGLYQLRRATMLDLIRTAYGVDAHKVLGGPNWLEVDRFDVRARVPAGTTSVTVRPMLQALLAERFGLVIRDDKKPVTAWALTAGKHPQMKQSDGSGKSGCQGAPQPAQGADSGPAPAVQMLTITCHNITMAAFAEHMGDMNGAWNFIGDSMVADQTGLEGAWDFELKYSRRNGRITAGGVEITSLFDAIDKIGLKLDPGAVPMPVIVVDKVNQTPAPNPPEAEKAFPPAPTEFEVAELKRTDPDFHGMDFDIQPGGRVNIRGVSLKFMVKEVWGLTDDMLVGAPKFMDDDRWDLVAKAPDVVAADGDADIDTLFEMVKTLLADRFQFKYHMAEKPVPAFTMNATKPKMKKADPNSRTGCKEGPPTLVKLDPRNTNPVLGRLMSCTNVTMPFFADQLQYLANGYVHSPVLDATGLEGGYDFTLSFSTIGQFQGGAPPLPGATATSADPNGAISLPDAMEKQLGLKLEPVKRQLAVMVIDHVEQKPTDN